MLDLDELIQRANELEPLPASAVRLASLLGSGQCDLTEVADIIAYDEALTVRLLRAANSAATGGATRVTRAQEAVFRLGASRVMALTVASKVNGLLKQHVKAYNLSEGALWEHSVATAAAAETLQEFTQEPLPQETFTASLLHDIGKLVMGRFLTTEDLEWLRRAACEGGLHPLDAERQILGVHHGELGGIIAQHWQLPEGIVKGIIYHHSPEEGLDPICDAVYVANLLGKVIADTPSASPTPASLERLGIDPGQMESLTSAAKARFTAVKARYNSV
ncbi:MAG: HDOD domain-containing protein [Verrucomicrobiales bacterium]|nr:HDOD domain-containing protein [Verrucomicrobiales bacterium]